VFAIEVTRIVEELGNAVLIAQRVARGSSGQVRIGFTQSASFSPVFASTFREFQIAYPDVTVLLEERPSLALEIGLREGRIDAAFLRPPMENPDGIALHMIEKEEMLVALPIEHRLAKRKLLDLKDLADEQFILFPRLTRPGLADAIVSACERAGFTPQIRQLAPQLSSTINLVAASIGISIVPANMKGLQPHAVSYVKLRRRPIDAVLGIAHRTNESSLPVLNLVALARTLKPAEPIHSVRRTT
jgi:DNA-binding transcriptional LysR family regulator